MMAKASPIEELAGQISLNAQRLSTFLSSVPKDSSLDFEPLDTIPAEAPEDIVVAQQELAENALALFRLARGPKEFLADVAVRYEQIASLQWLSHFRIHSFVPLEGSIPYASLAVKAQVPELQLKSYARMAMTEGLFKEVPTDCIAHSTISALMQTDPGFGAWAEYMADFSIPTASRSVEATTRWGGTEAKNQTAYNAAFATDLPFFDYLAQNDDLHRLFAEYMKSAGHSQGTNVKHLLSGFDWAGLGESVVVDVGGSTGHTSMALAAAHPHLTFVVQDAAAVIAKGEALVKGMPAEISSRVTFQAHNFFEPQPVQGAAVYLLRMILHDWPEKESISILRNLVPVLRDGSRVIVMDSVLPVPGSVPPHQESLIRFRDLIMMQVFNSRERAKEDWVHLFKKADERLNLREVKLPLGSILSVMELSLEHCNNSLQNGI